MRPYVPPSTMMVVDKIAMVFVAALVVAFIVVLAFYVTMLATRFAVPV